MALAAFCATLAHAGKTHTVRIEGMKFVPERLVVAPGDTVVWVNRDFLPHSVTAADSGIESGDLAPNKSWKYTARNKGVVRYICRLHPVMQATLVVQ